MLIIIIIIIIIIVVNDFDFKGLQILNKILKYNKILTYFSLSGFHNGNLKYLKINYILK
jgi:hypothetical protein